jgi:hypothetical protein
VLRAARLEMGRLAAGGPLTPQNADLQAARPYLRRCVMNMSIVELESITSDAVGDAGCVVADVDHRAKHCGHAAQSAQRATESTAVAPNVEAEV